MSNGSTIQELLDFAMEQEQEASDFYMDLASKAKGPAMKEALEQFAMEERGHKAKLARIKTGKMEFGTREKVMDLKLADYLVDEKPHAGMDYQAILIMAMKKEKAAFKMYMDLAGQANDPAVRDVFLSLAQEEAKHKLRFEIEYDDEILAEN